MSADAIATADAAVFSSFCILRRNVDASITPLVKSSKAGRKRQQQHYSTITNACTDPDRKFAVVVRDSSARQ
jgi:hypothetical protein